MAIYVCPIHPIPRDAHYNIKMEYSSIKFIKFIKATKKQKIDYVVTALNPHQVKTALFFHKLPTTAKDIMLTLVTHQNLILYKKRLSIFIYLSGFPPENK